MANIKDWISAFRLRTLPLSLSSIVTGTAMAYYYGGYDTRIATGAALTTIFLQILSNLANDFGDGIKGTDNEQRLGPMRAIQSGAIGVSAMRNAVILFSILSLASGIWLIYEALKDASWTMIAGFFGLGLLAIWAAIQYTVGKRAYGYRGMGDFFVFVFFGLVGVIGTCYLQTHSFEWHMILPAITIGAISMAVLNLNNMRDIDNDRASGKMTLAVHFGLKKAKNYHGILLLAAGISSMWFATFSYSSRYSYLVAVLLFVWAKQFRTVLETEDAKDLDPLLKETAISALIYSALLSVGILAG